MRNIFFLFLGSLLLVVDVFGVDVSVMEGDSVTLKPDTAILEDDSAQWFFDGKIIAQKKANELFSTTNLADEKFKDCLNLDKPVGSLNITNIRTDHNGTYRLFSSNAGTSKIFNVSVRDEITTVSVKKGEFVTLRTGLFEMQGHDLILWKFGDQLIAEINKETNQNSLYDTRDKRFKGRLQLIEKSGSLTISDSETTDSGDYHLYMNNSTYTVQRNISVTVSGESGDKEVEVSVMEGDSVTLKSDAAEEPRDGDIRWKFNNSIIVKINTTQHVIYTSEGTGRFRDRLKLDNQTGSLTITNIRRTTDSGDYELKIMNTEKDIIKKFSVNVRGKMTTVSVKEGESITLDTGLIGAKGYDLIMWKFKDHRIAKLNKGTVESSTHDTSDERFKGRLKLGQTTVSLIISNSRITDSGDYHLIMISSSHTVQRTINVTVSELSKPSEPLVSSDWTTATIVLLVFLILILILILIFVRIKCQKKVSRPTRRLSCAWTKLGSVERFST
ncbi:T-lymphocyte surface antigen Ly-9-like isoform X2 [Siphateles boraxobius]|uniref:T-lymphocyte surface antigen Ly-9-like isoform X2 n=1 Tax=Siphateles boraxobius TaxID=180520 RepID=UPI0040649ED4